MTASSRTRCATSSCRGSGRGSWSSRCRTCSRGCSTTTGTCNGCALENVAVGPEDGPKTFYHLRDASDAGRPGLPIWFDALGSFNREVVLAHRRFIPDIDSRIVELQVPCVTFDTLCRRNGVEHVDFLHTDTEGYDFEILKSVDFDRFRPTLIVYESVHLRPEDKQAGTELLGALTMRRSSTGSTRGASTQHPAAARGGRAGAAVAVAD